MLTSEAWQSFNLKSKDMKRQTPSNERRIPQQCNHISVLVHISMFWNSSGKKKIKDQTGKYLHGRFIQGHSTCILDWFTPESLKKKIRIRCYWWQVSATTKTKHFLHLCLLPFLSDVAFHAHVETKDIYKKKTKKKQPWSTLQGFSYRKQMLNASQQQQ